MRSVAFELGAVSLLRGLTTSHRPDYLLLRPYPPEFPAWRLNVAVLLVVVQRNSGLGKGYGYFTGYQMLAGLVDCLNDHDYHVELLQGKKLLFF
jgi:hypothetical protein